VSQLPPIFYEGFMLMKSSIIMVALASILGNFLRVDLHTGSYLASVLLGSVPLYCIPVMVFLVSLIITITTGSAWGTFSLLIPITVQMLIGLLGLVSPIELDSIPLLFPTLGALLSGAACGNHIAPFAETTVMTAQSTAIEPLRHARTQLWYVVPVVIGAVISFAIVGFIGLQGGLSSLMISYGIGIFVTIALLLFGNRFFKKTTFSVK
jgi:Na+/H+ antiporter NhaC